MAFQLFPSISFNEDNVGPRPLRSVTVDRVGMVGQFSRGPSAPAIADANDATRLFGADTAVGSVQLQAILDQGVGDLLISRVLPRARRASLNVGFTGTVAGTGTFSFGYKVGSATQVDVPVTLVVGDTASVVAGKIAAAVQAHATAPNAVTVTVGAGNTGTTGALSIQAVTAGATGNTIQTRVTITGFTGLTWTTPATFATALASLTSGADAPKAPEVTLVDGATQLLKLTMIHPGTSGNVNTKAIVSDAVEDNRFDLVLTNEEWGITEVYRDLDLTDIYDVDKLARLRNSSLATGVVLSTASVPAAGSFNFTGGTAGDATVTTEDFIAAIDSLEDLQCTIICAPGLKPNGVDQWALNAALVSQAEAGEVEMGELIGLRIAVVSAPRGTVAADLPALKAAARIPDSKRTVMVAGWGSSARQPRYSRFGVDPSATYAGHLLVTRPQISPAARTSSPTIKGITEVDTPAKVPQLNEFTRYRMDAVIIDLATGAFHMLNGRSTSTDPAWYWVMYRRVYDKIRTDVFIQSQFTKSEPARPELDRTFQNLIDGYLENQLASGLIMGYNPTVSNDSNNPPGVRALGQRYVDVFFELIPANDFTEYRLNRVTQATVRVA